MHYSPFFLYFPQIADDETRHITFRNHRSIPDGQYGFLPFFCNDKTCDCRRTLISVAHSNPGQEEQPVHVATISYGWESLSFYKKWGNGLPLDVLNDFKGPALDVGNPNYPYSEALLHLFNQEILDPDYIERLKREYAMYKYKQGMKLPIEYAKTLDIYGPCPCGSEQSFKFCCGKKTNMNLRKQ